MFNVEGHKFKTLEEAHDFAFIFAMGAEVVFGCPIGILIYEENLDGRYGPSLKEANILMVFSTHTVKAVYWEAYMDKK